MRKVLLIRDNVEGKADGINSYCNSINEMFKEHGEIYICPACNYKSYSIKFIKQIYKSGEIFNAIKNSNADVVHINGYTSFCTVQAITAAYKLNKKIVYTPHWHPFKYLRRPLLGKLFFYLILKRLIVKRVNTIITINKEDSSFFRKFHNHVVQIPHWLRMNDVQHTLVQNKNPRMILFVGRLDGANKGVEHLFQLPVGRYEIHLVGSGKIDLRSDMQHHKNVSDEELVKLYQESSLLVVPSTYEAFSYAALEALCLGTPVVISNGVRIGDYLENANYCSRFEYGDYQSFVEAVQRTISTTVNVEYIKCLFDKNVAKERYVEVYSEM